MAALTLDYSYAAPLGPVERARNILLAMTLLLYGVLNAGVMQIRLPPGSGVPLAEVTLILCLLSINYGAVLGRLAATVWLLPLLLWWGWGFLRLGVDFRTHGIWAMRDALQLIESLFLLVGFAVINREWLVDRAFRWIGLMLAIGCAYALTYPIAQMVQEISPVVASGHGLDVPVLGVYVTSAIILMTSAAWLLLFHPRSLVAGLLAAGLLGFAVLIFQARIIYLCVPAVLLVLVAYRRSFAGHGVLAVAGVMVAALAIPLLGIGIAGRIGGEVSLDFMAHHFLAIFGSASETHDAASAAAEGVDLRLGWWLGIYERLTDSVASAVFGLGFGIPLTDRQVAADVLIREPHNSYISIVGRMGLLGLLAWVAMHVALLGSWLRCFRLYRRAGDRRGQDRLVLLLVFFVILWVTSMGEDGFEKPFNVIPYYLAWGLILRMAYFAELNAGEAATGSASSNDSPSWAGATPSGSRASQSS